MMGIYFKEETTKFDNTRIGALSKNYYVSQAGVVIDFSTVLLSLILWLRAKKLQPLSYKNICTLY